MSGPEDRRSGWSRFAPLVLLGLAGLVWFEHWMPGKAAFHQTFGEQAVLRFVVGLVCVYLALLLGAQRHLQESFRQVLATFRDFHKNRSESVPDAAQRRQALLLLCGALSSQDANVRETALENLKRLSGLDHGEDAIAWRRWIEQTFPA